MKQLKLAILFLLFSGSASAGSIGAGKISLIHFMDNGVVAFTSNGVRQYSTSDSSCFVNVQPQDVAIDASTDQGKAQLAGLLMAYAQGKSIVIQGTGQCSAHPSRETVSYFYIVD